MSDKIDEIAKIIYEASPLQDRDPDTGETWYVPWDDIKDSYAVTYEHLRECAAEAAALVQAPVQVGEIELLDHFRDMQSACTNYLTPEAYVARYPKTQTDWDTTFPMPHKLHSEHEAAKHDRRRDKAFIADIIRMLDGPEQREAEAALSLPLPVQERVSPNLIQRLANSLAVFTKHYETWMDRWADEERSSTFSRHTFGELRQALNLLKEADAVPLHPETASVREGSPTDAQMEPRS
jgi:hypothetical protein